MLGGTRFESLSERLQEAIITSVRYTDTVTKYGKGQYLILLINTSYEDCSIIAGRINKHFRKPGQRTSVDYSVSNIIINAFNQENKIV